MNEQITNEQITEKLNAVSNTRKDKRTALIKEISLNFLALCKARGVLTFPREHLNFLCDGLNERTQQKTISEILNFLKENKLIREDKIRKAIYSLVNKPLISFDYGSYNLMMAKNGYKRKLYKWINEKDDYTKTHAPKRKLLKTLDIDEPLSEDLPLFDESEITSNKPIEQQAVFTNSALSVVRDFKKFDEKIVYTIL